MKRGGGRARRVAIGLALAVLVAGCSTTAPPAAVPDSPAPSEPTVPSTRPADPEPEPVPAPPTTTATTAATEPLKTEAPPTEPAEAEVVEPETEPVAAADPAPVEPDAGPEVEATPEQPEPVTEDTPATEAAGTPEPEDPVPVPVPTGEIIEFAPGEDLITIPGTVAPGERRAYVIEAVADIRYTFTLGAPVGVWLDAGLGEDVTGLPGERPRRAALVLPANATWLLEVVSTAEEPADYEITATVHSLDRGPAPPGPVVYLTFDDGPHPVHTSEVLDVLRRHGVRATFFVVGAMVERFPHLLNRVLLEGHTVANHTWNHENLAQLSGEAIDRTIERTQEILGANATACMRPPYGALDDLARQRAEEHGLDVIMWSASAHDWTDLTAETIAKRIVAGAVDGGIILMHDGGGNRTRTVEGLDMALQQLSGQGIRFEPICAL